MYYGHRMFNSVTPNNTKLTEPVHMLDRVGFSNFQVTYRLFLPMFRFIKLAVHQHYIQTVSDNIRVQSSAELITRKILI